MSQTTPFNRIRLQLLVPRSLDLAELDPPPKIYLHYLTSAYPSLPESLITPVNSSYRPMSANVTSDNTVKGG